MLGTDGRLGRRESTRIVIGLTDKTVLIDSREGQRLRRGDLVGGGKVAELWGCRGRGGAGAGVRVGWVLWVRGNGEMRDQWKKKSVTSDSQSETISYLTRVCGGKVINGGSSIVFRLPAEIIS